MAKFLKICLVLLGHCKYEIICLAETEVAATILDGAGSQDDVVDVYEHALFSRYPKPRYLVRWDAYMLAYMQWLPEWLGNWFIRRMGWHWQ